MRHMRMMWSACPSQPLFLLLLLPRCQGTFIGSKYITQVLSTPLPNYGLDGIHATRWDAMGWGG